MSETVVKISNLKKQYRLGVIGGTTLQAELSSWWAKMRGREDPNTIIGVDSSGTGEKFWALNGINLEVSRGEALGVIGTNGAGKSTLLKILSRVTAPTEGEIKIKGRISSMLEVGTGFHAELTGRENIYLNGAILGMNKREVDEKMEDIIDFSECRRFIDTPVKRYSSGMYVKLAFAVSAFLDSDIMIMDEVLAVGDMKFQKKCLGKMSDASNYNNKTIFYVSHNMNTIKQLCTRCVVLAHGELIYDGDVETAIGIYSDQEKVDMQVFYELTNVKRPSNDHGRNLHIDSFLFLDKESPVFRNEEMLKFRIEYTAQVDIENLRLYYIVEYVDSSVAGTTHSDVFGSIKAGERQSAEFAMDISNLISGVYYFYVDIFSMNEFGTRTSYDHPLQKIYFEIEGDGALETIQWQRKYMGNVRLAQLETIQAAQKLSV